MERYDHHFGYGLLCRFAAPPFLSLVLALEVEGIAFVLYLDFRSLALYILSFYFEV